MATWHVSYEFGSALNDGTTQVLAKATLNQAVALASDGDTIEVWDTARPYLPSGAAAWNAWTGPTITTTKRLTLHFNDFVISGHSYSGDISLAGWSAVDANTFEKTITTGLYIDGVLVDFDPSDQSGWYGSNSTKLPNCDLRWVADRATCIATAYSWFYNTGTGLLTVNTQGVDPATSPISIVRGNNRANPYAAGNGTAEYSGMTLESCSNLTFTGTLYTYNINKFSNTAGYGVYISSSGTDINWFCRSIHHGSGYHGWGGAGTGGKTRIVATNLLIGTCQRQSTHIVLYGSGNGVKITACDISGFEIHTQAHLRPDNSLVQAVTGQMGLYAHTGGPGSFTNNTIASIRFHDGIIYGYGNGSTGAFNTANADAFAGDNYEEAGRSVVFERITVINGSGMSLSGTMLIKDCVLDFAAAGSSGTSATGAIILNTSPTGDVSRNNPLFAGCVILANLDRAATANYFNNTKPGGNADFTAGDGMVFKNCTIIDQSTQTQNVYWFICRVTGATRNSIYARGTAFIVATKTAASSNFCGNDASQLTAELDFKTNAYIGISTTAMSDVATRNTQAEWTSVIETGTGVQAPLFSTSYANCGFVSASTGEISAASILHARNLPSNRVVKGINKALFSGTFGAWQRPRSSSRNIRPGRIKRVCR